MAAVPMIIASCGNRDQKPGYAGQDLSGKVAITESKDNRESILHIKTPGKWALYAGPGVEDIDMSEPLITGQGEGDFTLPRDSGRRKYYQFVSGPDRAIIAERHLPLTGVYNARDLGGYRTADGRHVKWGKILRSDDLHDLTQEDRAYLASLPVNSVVDFRSRQEIEARPDSLPSGVQYYELSITPGNIEDVESYMNLTPAQVTQAMEEMNRYFATSPEGINRYREFFRLLQEEGDAPLLFHCSAGKDRTGMGAALVLYALNVPEETIMEDYMLSNNYVKEKYGQYIEQYPQLEGLFEVKPEYLRAGIESIKGKYGSVDKYLRDELGVNVEKLREAYLY